MSNTHNSGFDMTQIVLKLLVGLSLYASICFMKCFAAAPKAPDPYGWNLYKTGSTYRIMFGNTTPDGNVELKETASDNLFVTEGSNGIMVTFGRRTFLGQRKKIGQNGAEEGETHRVIEDKEEIKRLLPKTEFVIEPVSGVTSYYNKLLKEREAHSNSVEAALSSIASTLQSINTELGHTPEGGAPKMKGESTIDYIHRTVSHTLNKVKEVVEANNEAEKNVREIEQEKSNSQTLAMSIKGRLNSITSIMQSIYTELEHTPEERAPNAASAEKAIHWIHGTVPKLLNQVREVVAARNKAEAELKELQTSKVAVEPAAHCTGLGDESQITAQAMALLRQIMITNDDHTIHTKAGIGSGDAETKRFHKITKLLITEINAKIVDKEVLARFCNPTTKTPATQNWSLMDYINPWKYSYLKNVLWAKRR